MDKNSSAERKQGRSTVSGKEMFLGYIWMSPDRGSVGEEAKGKVIPCRWLSHMSHKPMKCYAKYCKQLCKAPLSLNIFNKNNLPIPNKSSAQLVES